VPIIYKEFSIDEKYISVHALPQEPINAWIKWNEGIEFDGLIFRVPKGVALGRLWNVHEDVYRNQGEYKGKDEGDYYAGTIVIDKKYLEVDGFFGFQCAFVLIPKSDKEINFKVEFVKNNETIHHEDFNTSIIVPDIRIRSDSDLNLLITEEDSEEMQLNLVAEKKGSALVRDLKMFLHMERISKDLEVNIKSQGPEEPAYTTLTIPQRLRLRGSGYAVLKMGFDYKDMLNNRYKSNTLELIISKSAASPREIPIESKFEGKMFLPMVMTEA
jgi:hypothetical protein